MSLKRGIDAEAMAAKYLEQKGYKILQHNVRFPFGEIDMVARDGDICVFVEVKYRKLAALGDPLDSVTKAKQQKIIKAAQAYLQKRRDPMPVCRFDVIAMTGDLASPSFEHIVDAFYVERF